MIAPNDKEFPFTYDTFESIGFDNSKLSISIASSFSNHDVDSIFYASTLTNNYDETKQNVDILISIN